MKSSVPILAPAAVQSQGEGLLTVREVAVILRVSPISVYRACAARHLPHLKDRFVGIRIDRRDLERYLEGRKIPTARTHKAKF